MIGSAFNSNEAEFKRCFEVLLDGAYEYFAEGMKWFSYGQMGL